jgi:pSer/pThr/pTyr-binding forkhead associated (FHA) protein
MADVPRGETRAITPVEALALREAEAAGHPFLSWRSDDGQQQIRVLHDGVERVTVGRKAESDVSLHWDVEVSRTHALLEHVGGQWSVVDDGLSTNGTYVNGGRVIGRRRLHDHDRICFGQTVLVFREPQIGERSDSTARVSSPATIVLTPTQRKVLIALCRPVSESRFATPATNKQIAEEVFLSVDAVKAHLRILFERFGLEELPQNEKRARLAARVLLDGIIQPHDF